VISLGPEQGYQISKRDIRQRLAVYLGTRSGGGFARLQEVGHPFGVGGPFPVIYGPTQSCNAVQATSRSTDEQHKEA